MPGKQTLHKSNIKNKQFNYNGLFFFGMRDICGLSEVSITEMGEIWVR